MIALAMVQFYFIEQQDRETKRAKWTIRRYYLYFSRFIYPQQCFGFCMPYTLIDILRAKSLRNVVVLACIDCSKKGAAADCMIHRQWQTQTFEVSHHRQVLENDWFVMPLLGRYDSTGCSAPIEIGSLCRLKYPLSTVCKESVVFFFLYI